MAGYPKIWTRIRHRPWFRKLGIVQRGIWYETIMIAKEQTDDGWVDFPNITAMAAEMHTNRTSIETWIARESHVNRISKMQKSKLCLRFFINEYNDSQQVRTSSELKKRSPIRREEKRREEREYIDGLKALKIERSIFKELKVEFPDIDHTDELRKADLYRLDNPGKGKRPNHHLFLRNWFKRASKPKPAEPDDNLRDLSRRPMDITYYEKQD